MNEPERLTPAGAEIVEALTEFYEAIKQGPEAVVARFTIRTVNSEQEPGADAIGESGPVEPRDAGKIVPLGVPATGPQDPSSFPGFVAPPHTGMTSPWCDCATLALPFSGLRPTMPPSFRRGIQREGTRRMEGSRMSSAGRG